MPVRIIGMIGVTPPAQSSTLLVIEGAISPSFIVDCSRLRRRLLRLIAALRRPGARYRVTALAQRMMDADTEPVIVALTEAAKGGDVAAIKLMLERIAPVPRVRTVGSHAAHDVRRGPTRGGRCGC